MTTVLTHAQDLIGKMGLPAVNVLVSGTDKSTIQIRSILQEVTQELGQFRWSQGKLQKSWLALGASDQGLLTAIFGAGYDSLVSDTTWNTTKKMQVFGPVSEQVWQSIAALGNVGPLFQCWVSNGHLYLSPAPKAGDSMSSIYNTKYNVLAIDGITLKERITADDDTLLFPDICVRQLLQAKWKKQKGEPGWEDDWNDAQGSIMKNIMRHGDTKLSLATTECSMARPGIVIPAGNWLGL